MLNCVNVVLRVKTQRIIGSIYAMCVTYAQPRLVCLCDCFVRSAECIDKQ